MLGHMIKTTLVWASIEALKERGNNHIQAYLSAMIPSNIKHDPLEVLIDLIKNNFFARLIWGLWRCI